MRDDDSEQESFITALARGDELGAVIRAQIYIEHELIGFIRSRLAAPDSLTDADLSYARLVRLALALGLSSEFAKPLQAFARIRNHFAHRLDTELTEARVRQFCQSFSAAMRRDADLAIENIVFPELRGSTKENLTSRGLFQMYSYYLWFQLCDEIKHHPGTK